MLWGALVRPLWYNCGSLRGIADGTSVSSLGKPYATFSLKSVYQKLKTQISHDFYNITKTGFFLFFFPFQFRDLRFAPLPDVVVKNERHVFYSALQNM